MKFLTNNNRKMKKEEEKKDEFDETDKCYLEYDEDGYLTCSYCHKVGAKCLMNVDY